MPCLKPVRFKYYSTSTCLTDASITANFKQYEMEDDVSKDLVEFSIANAVYAALVEGHAAEMSSRYAMGSLLYVVRRFNRSPDAMQWTMHPRYQNGYLYYDLFS